MNENYQAIITQLEQAEKALTAVNSITAKLIDDAKPMTDDVDRLNTIMTSNDYCLPQITLMRKKAALLGKAPRPRYFNFVNEEPHEVSHSEYADPEADGILAEDGNPELLPA